jgi:hypothetical protein
MSRRNTIRASLAMIAAGLAFGASSAGAMPARDGTPPAKDPGPASLASEQAQTQASAQDILEAQGVVKHADLRGEQAKQAAIDSGQATQPVIQGAPKFSTTKVTTLHSAQPLSNDDGTDVSVIAIILGLTGAGILGAGAAVAVSKTTRSRRAHAA